MLLGSASAGIAVEPMPNLSDCESNQLTPVMQLNVGIVRKERTLHHGLELHVDQFAWLLDGDDDAVLHAGRPRVGRLGGIIDHDPVGGIGVGLGVSLAIEPTNSKRAPVALSRTGRGQMTRQAWPHVQITKVNRGDFVSECLHAEWLRISESGLQKLLGSLADTASLVTQVDAKFIICFVDGWLVSVPFQTVTVSPTSHFCHRCCGSIASTSTLRANESCSRRAKLPSR